MAIDLNALATWSYDNGILMHIPTSTTIEIDIAANEDLHLILEAPHWATTGPTDVYSENPDDWIERKLYYNRTNEDPPVLGVEQTIGQDDRVDYAIILLEDSPGFGASLQTIADTLQDGVDNPPYTRAHARVIVEEIVRIFQQADLLSYDPFGPEQP